MYPNGNFFFFFVCFWRTSGSFLNFLLCCPSQRSACSQVPSQGGNPPENWQSAVGWGDAGFEPRDCRTTVWCATIELPCLPLSYHASHWATTPPIELPRLPLMESMSSSRILRQTKLQGPPTVEFLRENMMEFWMLANWPLYLPIWNCWTFPSGAICPACFHHREVGLAVGGLHPYDPWIIPLLPRRQSFRIRVVTVSLGINLRLYSSSPVNKSIILPFYLMKKLLLTLSDAWMSCWEVWNPAGADYVSRLTVLILPAPTSYDWCMMITAPSPFIGGHVWPT